MVFWGAEVKPGKPFTPSGEDDLEYEGSRLHLSQATLGLDGKGKERTVVKCKVGDGPELLLCSLTPGVSESCSLDLLFDQGVVFSVAGPTSVHLVGYYMPLDDEEEDEDYALDGSEFDSEDDEEDDEDDDEEVIYDGDLSRSTSSVKIEELGPDGRAASDLLQVKDRQPTTDNESDEERLLATKKRKATLPVNDKRTRPSKTAHIQAVEEESEDEDGFPLPSKKSQALNGSEAAPGPSTESNLSKKEKKSKKKKKNKTPARAEVESILVKEVESILVKEVESTVVKGVQSTVVKEIESTLVKGVESTPNKAALGNGSPEKNLAKTPARNGVGVSPVKDKISKKASHAIRKYANGLEIEEVAMGRPDARQTKSGKKISVYYTGKLKSTGKIFDSNVGKKPFSFRLGVGEVIKGWDVAIAGMRIGDKRKITVPPAMGYGVKGIPGTIPGNSSLVFDVEVIDVA